MKIDAKEKVDESSFKYKVVTIYLIVDYLSVSFERDMKNGLVTLYAVIRFEAVVRMALIRAVVMCKTF